MRKPSDRRGEETEAKRVWCYRPLTGRSPAVYRRIDTRSMCGTGDNR
jgi:hypothetical protein